jgi:hypothetical protein
VLCVRGKEQMMSRYQVLHDFLLRESVRCLRPAVARFRHPWIAPMPLTDEGAAFLRARAGDAPTAAGYLDVFNSGDYSLGMFHHDASEAAIELANHPAFHDALAGTLLNFLDCARADGLIHRIELCHKAHELEPSKPVMAQFAVRIAQGMGEAGVAWLIQHSVYDRLKRYLHYLEVNYTGMHGLILAHSALQTGFDNDLLTFSTPDCSTEDPGATAFMILEYEAMASLAQTLNMSKEATWNRQKADRLRTLLNELAWYQDDGGGFYVALRYKGGVAHLGEEVVAETIAGKRAPLHSWVSFLPLYAGVPSDARAEIMCRLLLDYEHYWSPAGVRTLSARNVYFNQAPRALIYDYKAQSRTPVSNWMGPVWILSNYYLAQGLARYGKVDEASEIARRTADLLLDSLNQRGSLFECYNDEGRGLWPAGGGFVSWNVLALTLLRDFLPEETSDFEPLSELPQQ